MTAYQTRLKMAWLINAAGTPVEVIGEVDHPRRGRLLLIRRLDGEPLEMLHGSVAEACVPVGFLADVIPQHDNIVATYDITLPVNASAASRPARYWDDERKAYVRG